MIGGTPYFKTPPFGGKQGGFGGDLKAESWIIMVDVP